MFVNEIKQSFNDDVIYKLDRFLCNPDSNLETFEGISPQKHQEAVLAARSLCLERSTIRFCRLCHHTELVIDEWASGELCLGCYNIRNNRSRVQELINEKL